MKIPDVKWLIAIPILGAFLVVLAGVTHWVVKPSILDKIIEEDYIGYDKNGSFNQMTRSWENPTYDMILEIYVFNVKNSKDILNGSRPILEEKGPYTFIEHQSKKFNISGDRERVIYRNNHVYIFSQNLSCSTCLLQDRVTVPNVLLQKLVDYATGYIARFIIEEAAKLANENAFITVTVNDLLFNGYNDPLVSKICSGTLSTICKSLNIPDKIGIFYKQNNTDDGAYEINTGISDRNNLGKLYTWNNMSKLGDAIWYGSRAREIRGGDGQLYKPFLSSDVNIELFVAQVCRVVEMQVNQQTYYKNINVYEYGPADSMNNMTLQKELGFCNPNAPRYFDNLLIQPLNCTPAGVMDVSSCIPGNVRIYITQPFFYNCPAALHEAIDGIRRPTEDDRTFVHIHPETGVVIHAVRKSQINVGVIKGQMNFLSKMNNTIIPMLWLNETITADIATESMIGQVSTILKVLPAIIIVCITIGGFLFIGGVVSIVLSICFKETDVPLLADDNDDALINYDNDVQQQPVNTYGEI